MDRRVGVVEVGVLEDAIAQDRDERFFEEVMRSVAEDGLVCPVQNGMTTGAVADVVGARRTIGAVIEITSAMTEPGRVSSASDCDPRRLARPKSAT